MNVKSEQTHYMTADGRAVPIFLARPDGGGRFPALVMVYEFYGMLEVPGGGPHMRDVAARFARAGFITAVPDYYAGRGKQPTVSGGTISGGPSDLETQSDLRDCVQWLSGVPAVSRGRIGMVGWCGGGRHALLFAAQVGDIRAAASFYGRVANRPGTTTPSLIDLAPRFRCPVFGAYGDRDHAIPVDSVRQFERALSSGGVPHEIHIYPGAGHAFMNDQRESHDRDASIDSWTRLISFLSHALSADK